MSNGRVFARIADRYDRINTLLSLGQDQNWRRRAVNYLPEGRLLDLGGGTGAANPVFGSRTVVVLDPAPEMLRSNPVRARVVAVGEQLPFDAASFDSVFSAYVFRNLDSVPAVLEEIHRVLRPGGVAAVVDLGRPEGAVRSKVHRAGTATVLSVIGAAVRAREEYRYLHHSLDKLPTPEFMFGRGPLDLVTTWRMGPMGFVYGAVMRKADSQKL